MAGIGFVLRKLYRQDDLIGLARACVNAAFAATGPWLFTVMALGAIALLGRKQVELEVLFEFRTILIYNFSFSLVLSGAVFMTATRYLADGIHKRDVSNAPGMLLGALVLLWGLALGATVPFYFLYAKLPSAIALSAVVGFLLLCTVWLAGIFISALKNYAIITRAFLVGMLVAVTGSTLLAKPYGALGMLNGFSAGLAVIVALLLGSILAEYPYPIRRPFAFLSYFRKYWEIALSGLIYNAAVWVDKWIMWFAPEATKLPNGLILYPHYDSTMFLAYLTTVPAMTMFLFSAETHFFEHYTRFYRDIERKAPFARIEKNHRHIAQSIFGSAGSLFLLQAGVTSLCLLMAPEIIAMMKNNYLQIGMLRYGFLGALFQILTLFLLVLLSYFDHRKGVLALQTIFLVTNALLTWGSLKMGFPYYGFGYFLAAFVTFLASLLAVRHYVAQLPYHAFITNNATLIQAPAHPAPRLRKNG